MTPYMIIFSTLFLLIVISSITSLIGIKMPLLTLNENQILYLYSTSPQVLAGIYGLTLTGFIFFRNELSREEFEDETLADAVESLKSRYFKILMFITILTIFTLLMSNLVLSSEVGKNLSSTIIFMNIAHSSFFINLLIIAYFIFDVITPKRIEKESKVIQKKVDPISMNNKKGNLEDFLTNYNKLEYILQKYGQIYQSDFEKTHNKRQRRISNIRLAEFILKAGKIDTKLFKEIKNLITLRNSIIHGAEPVVSEKIVQISKDVLDKLANKLNISI